MPIYHKCHANAARQHRRLLLLVVVVRILYIGNVGTLMCINYVRHLCVYVCTCVDVLCSESDAHARFYLCCSCWSLNRMCLGNWHTEMLVLFCRAGRCSLTIPGCSSNNRGNCNSSRYSSPDSRDAVWPEPNGTDEEKKRTRNAAVGWV